MTVVCCGVGMSRCRSGSAVLKRMVTWRGGGAGERSRADGLRGTNGRLSRVVLDGEEALEGLALALAPGWPVSLMAAVEIAVMVEMMGGRWD